MFGQMVEYWYYTGDTTYNAVVTQGLLGQAGPLSDFMPQNQTETEVSIRPRVRNGLRSWNRSIIAMATLAHCVAGQR